MKNINDKLSVRKYIDLMRTATDFRSRVSDIISTLVYARLVHPYSKSKTYGEVIPKLFGSYAFSLSQLYDDLDTSDDCTNFYFEMDKEDGFRKNLQRKTEKNLSLAWASP